MFFFMGLAAGVITCVPIGPVNIAVIDAAFRTTFRRAAVIGIGGAIGDGAYALAGALGIERVLDSHPAVPPVLYTVSGIVLFWFGIRTLRSAPLLPLGSPRPDAEDKRSTWSAIFLGFTLVMLNPAAIVTWIFIVGSFMQGADTATGGVAAFGVFIGSLSWFLFVGYMTSRGKSVHGNKIELITRVVGYLLLVFAVYSFGRAVTYLI